MKGICTWPAALLFCSSLVARDASGANEKKAGLLLDRAREICALSTAFKKLATDMEAWEPRIVTRASGNIGDAVEESEEIDRKMDAAMAAYDEAVQRIPHERRADPATTKAHKTVRRLTFLRHAAMRNALAKQTCRTAAAVARGLAAQIDDFIAVFGSYRTKHTNSGCMPSGATTADSASATEAGCQEYKQPGNFEQATLAKLTDALTKFDREWTGAENQDKFFGGSTTKTCTLTDGPGSDTEAKLPTTGVPWAGGLWTISADSGNSNKPKITWNGGSTGQDIPHNETARKKMAELKDAVRQCHTQAREAEKLCAHTGHTDTEKHGAAGMCEAGENEYRNHVEVMSERLHAWANNVLKAVDTKGSTPDTSSRSGNAQGARAPASAPHNAESDSRSTKEPDNAAQRDNEKAQASSVAQGHTLALAHAANAATAAAFGHQLLAHTPRLNT
ncbi:putative Trypanosome variant surface glycoprotein (A type) [Trypanosoma vivax]|nr:putative Trypanosome variant surface glycoprotein (A type) [Trypanosoma vivax]